MRDLIARLRSTQGGAVAWHKILPAFLALLVGVAPAVAEHTRFWRQSDYDAF